MFVAVATVNKSATAMQFCSPTPMPITFGHGDGPSPALPVLLALYVCGDATPIPTDIAESVRRQTNPQT